MLTKIPDKAKKLFLQGKVEKEVETDKRIHFKVFGDTEEHSVIYDKQKLKWTCDCRYSALKYKECSHIIAARIKNQT